MSNRDYRLCYVDNNIMYFTDNFDNQWGDDWNDAPYEHNAGEPYELTDDEGSKQDGYGHIRRIAFMPQWHWRTPCDGTLNSSLSVNDINAGAAAWIYSKEGGALRGGATIDEATKWLNKSTALWGELTPEVEKLTGESTLDEAAKRGLLTYFNRCEEYGRHVFWDVLTIIGAEDEFIKYMAHRNAELKIA